MAGLLDGLFGGQGIGGGLLDYLNSPAYQAPAPAQFQQPDMSMTPTERRLMAMVRPDVLPSFPDAIPPNGTPQAPQAPQRPPQASPIAIGDYMMPRIGPANAYEPQQASIPPNAQPTQGQMPQMAPQMPSQAAPLPPALGGQGGNFLNGLSRGLQSIGNGGSILGALTGNYTDPQSMQQANLKAQYDSLVPVLGPQKAMLAILNPEAGKTLLAQALDKKQYGFQTLPDGTVVRQDPLTGRVEPAYQGGTKPTFGIIGEDDGGGKRYGFIDPTKREVLPVDASGGDSGGTVTGPDGKQIPVPPGVDRKTFVKEITKINADAAGGKKTEVQAKSEKFANKMENAEKNIKGIEGEGESYLGRAAEGAPLIGNTMATNWLKSEGYQKYQQARDNFITALLRDESGAAIGTEEFKRYERELFPQPGDSPAVVAQKREARQVAIEAMKKSAGPSYKSPESTTSAPSSGAYVWTPDGGLKPK